MKNTILWITILIFAIAADIIGTGTLHFTTLLIFLIAMSVTVTWKWLTLDEKKKKENKFQVQEMGVWLLLALMVLVVVWLSVRQAEAGEITVKVTSYTENNADRLFMLDSKALQINYQPSEDSLYYFISTEQANVITLSPAFKIKATGLGVGFDKPVSNNISFYGQLGYYFIDDDFGGRKKCRPVSCEGLYFGANEAWAHLIGDGNNIAFNEYIIETSDGIGGSVGAQISHSLSKNSRLVFGIEYRLLAFTIGIHAIADKFDYDNTGQNIESFKKRTAMTGIHAGYQYKW